MHNINFQDKACMVTAAAATAVRAPDALAAAREAHRAGSTLVRCDRPALIAVQCFRAKGFFLKRTEQPWHNGSYPLFFLTLEAHQSAVVACSCACGRSGKFFIAFTMASQPPAITTSMAPMVK